jgi:hypothetical protein
MKVNIERKGKSKKGLQVFDVVLLKNKYNDVVGIAEIYDDEVILILLTNGNTDIIDLHDDCFERTKIDFLNEYYPNWERIDNDKVKINITIER